MQSGQASVELVATIPMVALAILCAVQMAAGGAAMWAAGAGARAAARADHVGTDPRPAARSAVPRPLRVRVAERRGTLVVGVRVPRVLPIGPRIWVRARASLDPAAG